MRPCAGAEPKKPAPSSSRSIELDGTGVLYGPAPQAVFDDARPAERVFSIVVGREVPAPDNKIEERLVRETRFDPDLWVVEVEDRGGRNFLDNAVSDAS